MKHITRTRKILHLKELDPRYLIRQRYSRPRYIIHHNSHMSNNYFLLKLARDSRFPYNGGDRAVFYQF